MALPDPTQTAPENWMESCVITEHLVQALRGQVEFWTADHMTCLQEGRAEVWRRGQQWAEEAMEATLEGSPVQFAHQLKWATKTGGWLTVQPCTLNGTDMEAQEWRVTLFLRYGLDPLDLPTHCDGCNVKFTISYALDCRRGGLVAARHNELRDEVAGMAGKVFTNSHVRNNPLKYSGRAMNRTKAMSDGASGKTYQAGAPPPEVTEQKGDLLIRDL